MQENMGKVNLELAQKEVQKWLDFKKVDDEKIEDNKENILTLSKAVSSGCLSLDSDFNFVHELKFPITDSDGNVVESKLNFKPRLKVGELQTKTQNVKTNDTFALITAYISALTDLNSGIIKQMDSEDYKVAQGIVIFFL
jgi:hypothetical protein